MKIISFGIALFALFLIPSTVFACSCLTGDPASSFNSAKAVFIGRMLCGSEKLSVRDQDSKLRSIEAGKVRFRVEDVFKGEIADEVEIEIASMDGTSCGPYGLSRGEQYVVYAYVREGDEQALYSGVCTRTGPTRSEYAKEDLDFLRNLPPPGVGGNLRGRIWADLRAKGVTPLPDVRVNIRGADDQLIPAFTDKDGWFDVKHLKPGKYKVEPELPANYTSKDKSVEVTVDDRGTAGVAFEVYIDGRVSGRVTDEEGRGFNSIFLKLVGDGKTVYGHSTGSDGGFEVEGAPPGDYLLFVELQSADYNKNQLYYYPGTYRREDAVKVRVGLGERIEGLQFLLPDSFKVRTVEGQVQWMDGSPAAEVEVMLLCPQSTKPRGFVVEYSPTSTITDEQGRFRLEGFTGETYWIEARGTRESSNEGTSDEMHSRLRRISLNEDLKNVKLVLSEKGFSGECGE